MSKRGGTEAVTASVPNRRGTTDSSSVYNRGEIRTKAIMVAALMLIAAVFGAIAVSEQSNAADGEAEGIAYTITSGAMAITCTSGGTMPNYDPGEAPWYGDRASIESITIALDITTIGDFAFYGLDNSAFTSYTIPAQITSVGIGAFGDCSSLASFSVADTTYFKVSDGVLYKADYSVLIAYPCAKAGTVFDIPTTAPFERNTLRSVQGGAFIGASNITEFTNEGSNDNFRVDGMGTLYSYNKANMYCCPSDTSGVYSILSGTVHILAGALSGCSSLTSINIPESVHDIGTLAFEGCSGLTAINIPANMESLDVFVFDGCTALKSINVEGSNSNYYSDNGVLFDSSKTLIKYPYCNVGSASKNGSQSDIYCIPYGTLKIGKHAFAGSPIKYCTFTEKLTTIGYKAFCGSLLNQVQFNVSLTTLEQEYGYSYAFADCVNLKMASVNTTADLPPGTFEGCSSLTFLIVDQGTGSVDCRNAVPMFIANGYYKFAGISGEEEHGDYGYVQQTSDLTALGAGEIYSTNSLNFLAEGKAASEIENWWSTYLREGKSFVVHSSGSYSANAAYGFYSGIDEEVTWIKNLDSSVNYGMLQHGMSKTPYEGFRNTMVEYIYIPESVEYIEYNLFGLDNNLKYTYIPQNVLEYGNMPFYRSGAAVSIGVSPGNPIFSQLDNLLLVDDGKSIIATTSSLDNVVIAPGITQDLSVDWGSTTKKIHNSIIFPETMELVKYGKWVGAQPSAKLLSVGNAKNVASQAAAASGYDAVVFDVCTVSATSWYGFAFGSFPDIMVLPSIVPEGESSYNFKFSTGYDTTRYDTACYQYVLSDGLWTAHLVRNTAVISSITHNGSDGVSGTILSGKSTLNIQSATNANGEEYYYIIHNNMLVILGENVDITPSNSTGTYPWESVKSSITHICMQEGITGIGDGAFSGFTNLTACKIAYTVEYIGADAFKDCGSATTNVHFDTLLIPGNVATIDKTAFRGCTYLERLYVSDSNDNYSYLDGVIYSKDYSHIVYCPEGKKGTLSLPDATIYIDEGALYASTLSIINMNNAVTIGDYAFYASGISNISIPDSVTKIGDYAFKSCPNLISIIIGQKVSEIGDYAFADTLSYFELTDSDTEIEWGTSVFLVSAGFDWYRDFYLQITEDGVLDATKLIRGHSFATYNDLPETSYDISVASDGSLFAIYNPVTRILSVTEMVETDSSEMIDFVYDDSDVLNVVDDRGWADYLSSIEYVSFNAEHLCNVGDNMLRGIISISTATIPASVETVGESAFRGMNSLETFSGSGLKTVGDNAFQDNTSLTSIDLGQSLTAIGDYAFCGTALASVDFPSTLQTIGNHAFENSTLKGIVTIPNSVTSIGDYAFYRTANATSDTISAVVIGSSVTSIGDYAFAGHGAIATVLIRGSSGSVLLGDHVFSTYDSSEPAVYTDLQFKLEGEGDAQALTSSVKKGTFWIIDGSSALKLGSDINAYVADGFVFISGSGDFYSLGDVSFTDKDAWLALEVKEIVISGVTNIGTSTGAADLFQQSNVTSHLTSLSLYDAVEIPAGAFLSCSGLAHIAIPVSAFAPTVGYSPVSFSMGADAFDLAALESIDTVSNEGVSTFELSGDYAFEQAGNLIIVKNAVWQDSEGNWATSFQDGGSYRPIELSGYVSNGYTASLTTTM